MQTPIQASVMGEISSKAVGNGGTKFDIPLSNGTKPSTFDAALATRISQFGGQPFIATLEQKGQYTNIVDAQPLPGVAYTPQAATPIAQAAAAPVGGNGGGGGRGFSEEDKVRITKLAVLGTAYGLVSQLFSGSGPEALEEAVTHADGLAKKLYADARSHEAGAVPPQSAALTAPQPAVTPDAAAVAAFVAAQGGQPVQVGVEAVQPAAEPAVLPWTTG